MAQRTHERCVASNVLWKRMPNRATAALKSVRPIVEMNDKTCGDEAGNRQNQEAKGKTKSAAHIKNARFL
jgi:hypothetical protein